MSFLTKLKSLFKKKKSPREQFAEDFYAGFQEEERHLQVVLGNFSWTNFSYWRNYWRPFIPMVLVYDKDKETFLDDPSILTWLIDKTPDILTNVNLRPKAWEIYDVVAKLCIQEFPLPSYRLPHWNYRYLMVSMEEARSPLPELVYKRAELAQMISEQEEKT